MLIFLVVIFPTVDTRRAALVGQRYGKSDPRGACKPIRLVVDRDANDTTALAGAKTLSKLSMINQQHERDLTTHEFLPYDSQRPQLDERVISISRVDSKVVDATLELG